MSTVMKRYAVRVVAVVLCITMFTACNRYQDTDTTTTQAANQASTDPGAESSEPGSDLLPDRFESGGEDETGTVAEDEQTEAVSDETILDGSDAVTEPPTEDKTEPSTENDEKGTNIIDGEPERTEDKSETEVTETITDAPTSTTEENEETELGSKDSVTQQTTEESEEDLEKESTENTKETAAEVTTEETPESEAETEPTEAPTEPETEAVTQPTFEPETTSESEAEESTERETEAEVVLQSIHIKTNQSQYTEGWQLTKANLTVTVHYSDGTSGILTNGYTIHQTNDRVYVTYAGIESNTITVVYEKTLSSISIESKVDQYEQGYQLVNSNLLVTLHYSDGSTEVLTNGYSIHQSGASVYISFNGIKSNTININYAAASKVTIAPKQESYLLGEVITLEDFIVTVHQIDGSSEVVTEDLTLWYRDEPVTSVTLVEYEGDVCIMGAYGFQVSYKGVKSDAVGINVRYHEKAYLLEELLMLVNEARVEKGLPPLKWDSEAEEEIQIRAEELTQLYAHNRPNGEFISELYGEFWGENIASGGFRSKTHAQTVFSAWMNSPGHQSLIMDSFELATGFVCAYYIATDANGYQAAYTVMWVTTN